MAEPRHVAVIDIGKTNAKVVVVDLDAMAEIDVRKMPNRVSNDGLYPHHDTERLWDFIIASLSELARRHAIDAISVTTHGATAALLDERGELALPILDYEHDGPDDLADDYAAVRPPFAESGTPRLPGGLNLGAQIFWQSKTFPKQFSAVRAILPYPQYWAFRLTGVLATEVTSLGCHTDLWNPARRDFSTMVDRLGWRDLMPPLRSASDRLGSILPEIAARTGLSPRTSVHCGIHDSNASLLPHVLHRKPPFAVVSTGTWVVAMAVGGAVRDLDPARDTLVNVNALGDPVPSARFMGGREYELLIGNDVAPVSDEDIARVLAEKLMLLPSVQQGSGPFPQRAAEWIVPSDLKAGERSAIVSFYLALMTATCLDLIGALGETIVEGGFADNRLFLDMLGAATGRPVFVSATNATGTSLGAAELAFSGRACSNIAQRRPSNGDLLASYAEAWRSRIA
ncbi:carbohydrate kinase [Mesorhizobium sp. CGMCC 1.15528]|uniref:Carbohydrate kinase n=1 Tax=Mesorhizobium zhangyense TaxID=1776730 RepID=A0A7C9VDF5_9HYPH|nr:FGGY-family carbohydrate kinase [Mesorhizobium zhangyense]NGN42629.1 carbohydrate kinase [Mesorhizobium zhangyense]